MVKKNFSKKRKNKVCKKRLSKKYAKKRTNKKIFKKKGGSNSDATITEVDPKIGEKWEAKDPEICKNFIKKIKHQSQIEISNDKFDKLYNLNSLEDNNTLEEIFNDMYSCLPEKVGDRSIMPLLVMFPTSNYITNLKFRNPELLNL